VSFSIQPWGDVYINGRSVGASPPVKQSRLAPGTYRVEIKNTTFTPYVVSVEVKSQENVSVRHRFQ
jgi:PEGA domain